MSILDYDSVAPIGTVKYKGMAEFFNKLSWDHDVNVVPDQTPVYMEHRDTVYENMASLIDCNTMRVNINKPYHTMFVMSKLYELCNNTDLQYYDYQKGFVYDSQYELRFERKGKVGEFYHLKPVYYFPTTDNVAFTCYYKNRFDHLYTILDLNKFIYYDSDFSLVVHDHDGLFLSRFNSTLQKGNFITYTDNCILLDGIEYSMYYSNGKLYFPVLRWHTISILDLLKSNITKDYMKQNKGVYQLGLFPI